jgi:hypothetical protein
VTEPQEPATPEQSEQPTPTSEPPEVPPEIQQQEFAYSDHRLYSQALYNQPVYVVDAIFGPGGLNQNEKHTPANVQTAINQMMQQPDKQFVEEVPQ